MINALMHLFLEMVDPIAWIFCMQLSYDEAQLTIILQFCELVAYDTPISLTSSLLGWIVMSSDIC